MTFQIPIQLLPHAVGLELPRFETPGAAGADVRAAIHEPVTIEPSRAALIPTGLKVAIPVGFEIQVRPRSGLALKKQIAVLNSPGTIDSDYRGEVQIILMNLGPEPFVIQRGDRIAQLVLSRVERLAWKVVDQVPESPRGDGGFGHTGVS